jgi:hypothetical protein
MEFDIDSANVQIIIKNERKRISSDEVATSNEAYNSGESDLFELSNSTNIKYEVLLKLDDFYLINNLKLYGDIDEFVIHKIKFQSVKNGLWENVPYYNPDKKDITIRENDGLVLILTIARCQFLV